MHSSTGMCAIQTVNVRVHKSRLNTCPFVSWLVSQFIHFENFNLWYCFTFIFPYDFFCWSKLNGTVVCVHIACKYWLQILFLIAFFKLTSLPVQEPIILLHVRVETNFYVNIIYQHLKMLSLMLYLFIV